MQYPEKFCKDCKHMETEGYRWRREALCLRPEAKTTDPIDGIAPTCESERHNFLVSEYQPCGMEAVFFEPINRAFVPVAH